MQSILDSKSATKPNVSRGFPVDSLPHVQILDVDQAHLASLTFFNCIDADESAVSAEARMRVDSPFASVGFW